MYLDSNQKYKNMNTIAQPPVDQVITPSNLNTTETRLLKHIADGRTDQEIAVKLGLPVRTINSRRVSLKKKLQIHNTAGLVKFAVRHRVTTTDQVPNDEPEPK